MRRPILLLALCAALSLLACGGGAPTSLKLAHGLDVGHPVHQALLRMGEVLDERSGGRLRLEIYPSEQLGNERQCVELLQIGSLAMTKVSASVAEAFIADFRVFTLPYLFDDREHFFRVLEGEVGRELLDAGRGQRLVGLAYFDAGSRSFYTRETPILSPADLGGLKIRTQESASAMAMVRALGGAPTPISWGELYTALQQGVVDGAENNPPSFYSSRHYEVARHYSLDEHTRVPDVLLMSAAVWDRLSAEQQGWVREAARVAAEAQKEIWRRASEEALRAVEEAGVTIHRPDKEPFARRVEPLWREFGGDPRLAERIERIRRERAPTGGAW